MLNGASDLLMQARRAAYTRHTHGRPHTHTHTPIRARARVNVFVAVTGLRGTWLPCAIRHRCQQPVRNIYGQHIQTHACLQQPMRPLFYHSGYTLEAPLLLKPAPSGPGRGEESPCWYDAEARRWWRPGCGHSVADSAAVHHPSRSQHATARHRRGGRGHHQGAAAMMSDAVRRCRCGGYGFITQNKAVEPYKQRTADGLWSCGVGRV